MPLAEHAIESPAKTRKFAPWLRQVFLQQIHDDFASGHAIAQIQSAGDVRINRLARREFGIPDRRAVEVVALDLRDVDAT
jgi:hypothetical protein